MKTMMPVSSNATAVALGFLLITAYPRAQATSPRAQVPAAPATGRAAVNPCTAPANKIVAENCKPGNPRTEWDINSNGDPTIQGFATDMSVNVREKIDFKIRTHSPRYRIDIYRMGWYGGNGARLIKSFRPTIALPQAQPDCIEAPQRLVDCGNWKTSASWQVPADAVSGVYVARLIREDDEPQNWRSEAGSRTGPAGSWEPPPPTPHNYGVTGLGKLEDAMKEKRASHIIFVVRDDASRSAVLFQTADPTWVAFNRYGGSSLYGSYLPNAGGGGGGFGVSPDNPRTRAYIVSYNRPLDNRAFAVGNQFFNGEYPAVAWLERNGYDVSYFAGVDSDRRGERIKDHKIFVSAGHDTYWSAAQRANIESARNAGVNLAFLGGNTSMWKTRYLPSVEGDNRPNRTLVSYRETLSDGKLDPEPTVWTGAWRDSRKFNPEGPKPENTVVGTIGVVGPARNDRLEVPAKYGKLRFWRDTEVAALPATGTAVIGRGILGEEWDEDIDNGSRPTGLIRLSETTVDNVPYVQDWGSTYDSGTATHTMTLYRASSGALVFSAGSTQYSWGLGDLHTYFVIPGRLRPDPFGTSKAVQQATVNLFADMGVEPGALQPDLKPAQPSTDRTGPLAKIVSPQDGAVADGTLTIKGVATDIGGVVAGVEISVDGGTTWHPAIGTDTWSYEWQTPSGFQQATILARAVDDSGNQGSVSAGVQVRNVRSVTSTPISKW
jgi:hypothetical protein